MLTWIIGDGSEEAYAALIAAEEESLRVSLISDFSQREGARAAWSASLAAVRAERRVEGLALRLLHTADALRYCVRYGPRLAAEFWLARPIGNR